MLTWDSENPEQLKVSDHSDSAWTPTTVRDLTWIAGIVRRLNREVLGKRRELGRQRSRVLDDAIQSDTLRDKRQFERRWLRLMAPLVPVVVNEQPTVEVVFLEGSDW